MPTNAVQQMAIANQVLEDSLHVPGKIGRAEADGSYTIHVENKPNFVYVRVGTGEATGVIEAYNLHAPFKQDLRVICRKELNGDYVILGLDQGGGFLGVGDYNSPYHQHDHDSGLGWVVPGLQMEAGRVYFLDNFTVAIAPFRYKHGSDWYTYIGGTLDLSGDMPSTSGAHAWILIHVDPATGVAAATTGAEYAYATPLTISLLDDISIGDDIPLAAIMGREDAADLSDYALYYDAHGWFNLPGAGGGGGSSDWDDLTDVPANISELAAATSAADTLFYFDGVGSGAVTGLSAYGRTLIDDPDAATARATLGLAAGGAGDIWVEKAGDTMSGALDMGTTNKVVNLADPTSAQDAATKAYVDAVLQALDIKASVRAATTANITLSGAQTIDGVSVIAGDRVLVKNQSTGADNGIYVAAAGAWARSADANVSAEVTAGMYTFVTEGTANGDNGWVLTTNDPITLGSTALVFTQFSGAGQITAGSGLSKTGNSLDVNVDNTTIEISADTLQVKNLGITYAKIQNVTATDRILGRVSGGAGIIEEITFTDAAQALADDATAADMRTTLGLAAGGAGDIWVEKAGDTMTGNLIINSTATTGSSLDVTRNLASGSSNAPVVTIQQDHASDDQAALSVIQDAAATVAALLLTHNATSGGAQALTALAGAGATSVGLTLGATLSRALIMAWDESNGQAILYTNGFTYPVVIGGNWIVAGASGNVGIGLAVGSATRLGIKAGGSTNDAAAGGVLYATTTQGVNSGTGDTVLASYSVPANTLSVNNQCIVIRASGQALSGAPTVRVKFGATTILANVNSSTDWICEARIYRTGAATQKCCASIFYDDPGDQRVNYVTAAETLSGAITVSITGQSSASNHVSCEVFTVSWEDANT